MFIPKSRRLKLLAAIGVLLALGAMAYIDLFLARPIGFGPAGPKVEQARFANVWSERKVHLLGLGDSVTAGLGADQLSHSFFNRLRENPSDEFPEMKGVSLSAVLPNLTFENMAVSGSTSLEHLDRITAHLKPHEEDVFGLVVMTTGGNDVIHNYGRTPPREGAMYGATLAQAEPWIAAFAERLELMLDRIEAAFPGGCEIYLGDLYDPTDSVGDAPSVYLPAWPDALAIHTRYNEALAAAARKRENVFVVPLHREFLGHGSHCRQFWRKTYRKDDPHYWYYSNIEDPNDRGYDAIRRIFLNTILEKSDLAK